MYLYHLFYRLRRTNSSFHDIKTFISRARQLQKKNVEIELENRIIEIEKLILVYREKTK